MALPACRLAPLLLLLLVAACSSADRRSGSDTAAGDFGVPADRARFEQFRGRLNDNPVLRASAIDVCVDSVIGTSASERAAVAGLLGVPVQLAEREFCSRIIGAISSGRLSYDDTLAMRTGTDNRNIQERIIRILLSEPGGELQV